MGMGARIVAAIVAAASTALAFTLAANHSLNAPLASAAVAAWMIIAAARPNAWLFVIPALLPILNLVPWTGSLYWEEFDLLVLGAAAAGYGRLALESAIAKRERPPARSLLARAHLFLVTLFLGSVLISTWRGIENAGGLRFDGLLLYEDSLNTLRVAKAFVLALLVFPLTLACSRRSPDRASGMFASGMLAGLAVATLAVIWERVAFPGPLDFSSDYRVTGTFWEMNVGGAALDGFVALAAPFAVYAILRARSFRGTAIPGAIAIGGVYAGLVTFSRGLYVALAVSLPMQAALLLWQRRRHGRPGDDGRVVRTVAAFAATALAFNLVFRHGGYRTLCALLGALAASFAAGSALRVSSPFRIAQAIIAGVILTAASAWLGVHLLKGAYVLYALALIACFAASGRRRPEAGSRAMLVIVFYVCAALSVALVAKYWGGEAAHRDASAVVLILLIVTAVAGLARAPLFPEDARARAIALGVALALAGCVAVVNGGARMDSRFSTSEQDLDERIAHWRAGVSLLEGSRDWLFGKGLGRFPAAYRRRATKPGYPGQLLLERSDGQTHMTMIGPGHMLGGGELLRLSQRVSVVEGNGQYLLSFDERSKEDIGFQVEICEKHLLYVEEGHCAEAAVLVKAGDGVEWSHVHVPLDGRRLSSGHWFAPRLAFFSIALTSGLRSADVDNVSVVDARGNELIRNGAFSDGFANWFFTSDKYHLPWHMKNLGLAVLFDQGLLGALTLLVLIVTSVFQLVRANRAGKSLAPAMLAALTGFLLVGLFDSLVDVPRVAFLFYYVVVVGPTLVAGAGEVARHASKKRWDVASRTGSA